ncbi:flagellar brake protein [Noviherbaspirillum sedimenti]|uniref:Flagellar brake protein n=1 Tax=Noviherbaspirillum sedimenti TaxID=2320865 RepID=A0A3A3GE10_9BURK|nr:flagellar brake protein [Noviherbaspirillum sedimenti]RJG00466.1 flagellar brake protein [Noviherbaspirillum sedimenti]
MATPISLLPIRRADLSVGLRLGRPVYDWHGTLLLAAGTVIESQGQLDKLLQTGFMEESNWGAAAPSGVSAPPRSKVRVASSATEAATDAAAKETIVRMEDVHWAVGEAMTLQAHDKPSLRYPIQLIGFIKHRMLFVSAPTVDGKFELIREGQTFVARAFSGKKAYAFTAAALKSVHSPHPYLLLAYPREVRCTVVRQSARVQVRLIAAVALGRPERMAAGTITDLSTGGASVISKEPLGVKGETGTIKFKVHAAEADAYPNIRFILRSVVQDEGGEGFRQGLEFVDVPAHERLILSAFVHQGLVA